MTYPDPYRPQQQPYAPAPPPPGQYGHGYSPNAGSPPPQPYPQQQPPYQPLPAVAPQPAAKPDDGNSWGWQLLQTLVFFGIGTTGHSLGDNARDRAKTGLMLWGITLVAIAILVVVLVLVNK